MGTYVFASLWLVKPHRENRLIQHVCSPLIHAIKFYGLPAYNKWWNRHMNCTGSEIVRSSVNSDMDLLKFLLMLPSCGEKQKSSEHSCIEWCHNDHVLEQDRAAIWGIGGVMICSLIAPLKPFFQGGLFKTNGPTKEWGKTKPKPISKLQASV